jgi:hypothetical protein
MATDLEADATNRFSDCVSRMMKIKHIVLVLVAGFAFAGCADKKETMVQSSTDTTGKRTHTQAELRKTGETQVGPALEKVDPAVTISGPH